MHLPVILNKGNVQFNQQVQGHVYTPVPNADHPWVTKYGLRMGYVFFLMQAT